jgi:hypothetical protein
MIKESEDGGILITGTLKMFGIDQLFLIKTNSEGIVSE